MTTRADDLRVFLTVATSGNASSAARTLYMAQQSVSDRIRALEGNIGAPLFVRSSRGMALTSAGRCLLPYAQRCIELADRGYAAAREAGKAPLVVLAHSGWYEVVASLLPLPVGPPWRARAATCPRSMEASVLDGEVHAAVGPAAERPDGLESVGLVSDPIICVAPRTSHLVGRPALHVRDLAAAGANLDLSPAFIPAGATDESTPGSDATRRAADPTDPGDPSYWPASLCPRSAAQTRLDDGSMVELTVEGMPPWQVSLELVVRSDDLGEPAIDGLRDHLAQSIGHAPDRDG